MARTQVPKELLERLVATRRRHQVPPPLRPLAHEFAARAVGVLFPHFAPYPACSETEVAEDLVELREDLSRLVRFVALLHADVPERVSHRFIEQLADVHSLLQEDAQAIFEGDPAARSVDEVILTYPGFYAIAVYRLANALHRMGLPLLPRLLTEHAHDKTGIDIHPGAEIGRRFCIDHGTGLVIGETTRIGRDVKLYQGVTLGALTVEKSQADKKRHPTIEDEVVVYAGATILGGGTVVGRGSIVAGNAFVTRSVPPDSVVGRSGQVRRRGELSAEDLDFVI